MKVSPTDKEGTTRESSPKVSPSGEKKATKKISSMMSHSSSEKPIEPSSQEAHTSDTKITFTDNDVLFGETLHNRPLYMVGHVLEKKINRILINERSGVNILPIHTLKELSLTIEELSESRLLIHGFNQEGQRSIGSIKLEIHMEDLRSNTWMHVIDTKTSYNYLEDRIKMKIVVDDNPFTEVEMHFANAKFYLKSYVGKGTKSNDVKSTKSDKITSKRINTVVEKAKVDTKELCPNLNEGKTMSSKKNLTSRLRYVPKVKKEEVKSSNFQQDALRGLTLPIRRIDAINLPSKLAGKTIAQNQVRDVTLPTKRTGEEELKAKAHTVVYTKEHEEDEESVGSSYHVTIQNEHDSLPQMNIDEELEDIVWCCHIYVNDNDPLEEEDAGDALLELEEGVKTTIDPLNEVNLGTDEDPRPTYLSAFLEVDEEIAYMNILKEYRDVFAWSYKEMPSLNPKVAFHQLAVKNSARPVKQA
ncbi:hypothetical protein KY285_027110 [Solanum tuberosum]|nr:hypothetical protein KY285_027110 [Solanum tuberosum]